MLVFAFFSRETLRFVFGVAYSARMRMVLNAESIFCQSEVPNNGRYDLCSLNSVVAVFRGRVAIVLNFCNLAF